MNTPTARVLAGLAVALAAFPVGAVTLTVFGNDNPNLAGRPDGATCCSGDSVPAEAPTEVLGLGFSSGDALVFLATGGVAVGPTVPATNTPDGVSGFSMTNFANGISAPTNVRVSALMGVFLGPGDPAATTTPAPLSFAAGLDFETLSPGLNQIFFIGDGRTSSSFVPGGPVGPQQLFFVPPGATRLFLGSSDGFGWYNNGGSFEVDVRLAGNTDPQPVPTPGTLALLLIGLAGVQLGRARAHLTQH